MQKSVRILGVLLVLSAFAFGQTSTQKKTLVINGQGGEVTIYQIEGRLFVDLETLARIGNGTLSFQGNQIMLNFPAAQPAAPPPAPSGMSQDFMTAAVQDLNIIREWRQIIAYGLQRGVPGDGSRLVLNRDKAAEGLRLAKVAATTSSDQSALQLLTTHYNNVNKWYDKMVKARQNMETGNYSMTENAFKNDPTYQAMEACSNFLGTMIPSGTFSDDGSCHPL